MDRGVITLGFIPTRDNPKIDLFHKLSLGYDSLESSNLDSKFPEALRVTKKYKHILFNKNGNNGREIHNKRFNDFSNIAF